MFKGNTIADLFQYGFKKQISGAWSIMSCTY